MWVNDMENHFRQARGMIRAWAKWKREYANIKEEMIMTDWEKEKKKHILELIRLYDNGHWIQEEFADVLMGDGQSEIKKAFDEQIIIFTVVDNKIECLPNTLDIFKDRGIE